MALFEKKMARVIKSGEHMCLYLVYIVHLIESQLSSPFFLRDHPDGSYQSVSLGRSSDSARPSLSAARRRWLSFFFFPSARVDGKVELV